MKRRFCFHEKSPQRHPAFWDSMPSAQVRVLLPATLWLQVHRGTTNSYLLLHNKEECPPVAQAFGVKTWGQHVRVVDQGPWQQWY